MDPSIKYTDLLTKGHENTQYMRFELHRVWVLQATLKSGYRHQYAKRVLYLDEDTGTQSPRTTTTLAAPCGAPTSPRRSTRSTPKRSTRPPCSITT